MVAAAAMKAVLGIVVAFALLVPAISQGSDSISAGEESPLHSSTMGSALERPSCRGWGYTLDFLGGGIQKDM